MIHKDQYLPSLVYRQARTATGRVRQGRSAAFDLYTGGRLASAAYETLVAQAVIWMPWACAAAVPAAAARCTIRRACCATSPRTC